MCCPRCGCHEGLVPVCHPYMDTKTVTKYRYCCLCEDKCIPGKDCCCGWDLHLGCHEGCGDCGCKESCGCESCGCGCDHCKVREIKKLVKIPYKETVCVRKCWVEWVCPKCNCCCNAEGAPAGCTENNNAAPAAAPMPPAPPAPPANAAKSAVSDLPPVPAGATCRTKRRETFDRGRAVWSRAARPVQSVAKLEAQGPPPLGFSFCCQDHDLRRAREINRFFSSGRHPDRVRRRGLAGEHGPARTVRDDPLHPPGERAISADRCG